MRDENRIINQMTQSTHTTHGHFVVRFILQKVKYTVDIYLI